MADPDTGNDANAQFSINYEDTTCSHQGNDEHARKTAASSPSLNLDKDISGEEAEAHDTSARPIRHPTTTSLSTVFTTGGSRSGSSTSVKRKKKNKDMPMRNLSAYNIFFQTERPKILESSSSSPGGRVGFQDLAKIIGKRWKELDAIQRQEFERLAEEDSERYRREMDAYHARKRMKHLEKLDEAFEEIRDSNSKRETNLLLSARHGPIMRQDEMSELPPAISRYPFSLTCPLKVYHPAESGVNGLSSFAMQSARSLTFNQSDLNGWRWAEDSSPGGSHRTNSNFAIPQGVPFLLPDHNGFERVFTLNYKMVTMTRGAARSYMQALQGGIGGEQSTSSLPSTHQHFQQGQARGSNSSANERLAAFFQGIGN